MSAILEFLDEEACIDLTLEENFDVEKLASVLSEAGVHTNIERLGGLNEYIDECISQGWEVIFCENDLDINAGRGSFAKEIRESRNVYPPSRFVCFDAKIEDEDINKIFGW